MLKKKRLLGAGMYLFCLLMWFWVIPEQTQSKTAEEFPRLIVLFLAIPSVVLLVRPGSAARGTPWSEAEKTAFRKTAILLAVVCGYMILVPLLGFYSSSILGMVAILLCLGERRPLHLAAAPLVIVGFMYLGLGLGLSFQMPAGLLP